MGAGYAFGAAVHELGHSMKAADAKAYAKFESAVLGLAQSDAALEQIARQTAADYLSPDSPARAGLLDAQGNIDAAALNEEISLRLAQELVADPEKLVRAVERDRGLMETFLDFVRGLKNRIAIRLSGSERAMLDEAERTVPFPVSWTVKMKKKQKETQDILSYHSQAAGCSDKARAKASGGRQPIEECGRTGL